MNRVPPRRPVRRGAPAGAAPASEALLRLRKVLELELRRGCDNTAVIGGLDTFLTIARLDKGVAETLSGGAELTKPYSDLPPAARRSWLEQAIAAKPRRADKGAGTKQSSATEGTSARPSSASGGDGSSS